MNAQTCAICSRGFTARVRTAKVCSNECRSEAARLRAAAWHADHGHTPERKKRVAEASRRHYEKVAQDPALLRDRRAAAKRWRQENPDQAAAQQAAWRAANRERVRAKNQRRRARLLDAFVEDVDLLILADRDGLRCGICERGVDMSRVWPHRLAATVDHVLPLSKGGKHSYANAQLAHNACNARKGDRITRSSRRDAGGR